jgi:uncharacterized C2H2 Zn-finger protein
MAGFACPSCNAEFDTQEKLEDHKRKAHSGQNSSGQPSEPSPAQRNDRKE